MELRLKVTPFWRIYSLRHGLSELSLMELLTVRPGNIYSSALMLDVGYPLKVESLMEEGVAPYMWVWSCLIKPYSAQAVERSVGFRRFVGYHADKI